MRVADASYPVGGTWLPDDTIVYAASLGSGLLRVPAGVLHYVEPVGEETALNLDVFAPIRDDYKHLVEYQAQEFSGSPDVPAGQG